MKKNIKRYLSYVLGVILAMGLGLSYAYAVGANDSNAFVTTTEWETKVAQIEASLDNVTKTINDTNMDFMLNGPRLQASLIDGFENVGAMVSYSEFYLISHSSNPDHYSTVFPSANDIYLTDNYDGTQGIGTFGFPSSSSSNTMLPVRYRVAFKTNIPDIYLIVSTVHPNFLFCYYTHVGTFPIYNSQSDIPARNIVIELPRDKWKRYNQSTAEPTAFSRTNDKVFYGFNVSGAISNRYFADTAEAQDGFSSSTTYFTKAVAADKVTYTFEFPAQNNCIRIGGKANVWDLVPTDLAGRKLGGPDDRVFAALNSTMGYSVAKLYCPQKGFLCLKSWLIGEVPIINE